jgi:hypothetical protein
MGVEIDIELATGVGVETEVETVVEETPIIPNKSGN